MSWKDLYKHEWIAGSNREKQVRQLLEKEFPELVLKQGYGTEKTERIDHNLEHERGGPDYFVFHKNELLFHLEVTGTNSIVNDFVWIRPDKLQNSLKNQNKGIKTWFYTIYKNAHYILDTSLVNEFKEDSRYVNLYGRQELYIHIPCRKTYPKDKLFNWIRKKLGKLPKSKLIDIFG